MTDQPTGLVTFLFSDIEASTRLWDKDPEAMGVALARHEALLGAAIETNHGYLFKTVGDACYAAFADATNALFAALDAQLALHSEPWPEATPIRVRLALHTGTADARAGDYVGPALNHTARLVEVAHGGQTLLSEATRDMVAGALPVEITLSDLGAHRLRDLARPERIYQLLNPGLPGEFPALRSLDVLPHNLPIRRSRFVGRAREMAEIEELLTRTAILTLTGAGGAGKTRLALMVAAVVAHLYPDGVWFVDLAPLSDPDLVPQSVAGALGRRDEPGRTLTETLVDDLRSRHLLLLLDNCEHVVGAAAQLAQTLTQSCAALRILATSREPLDIEGELTWRVPGLAIPPSELPGAAGPSLVADVLRFEAVRLFLERVTAVAPGFQLTDDNALAVAEICRRLDGMPLAIELAAARAKVLSAEQILERLDDQLRLLTDGPRAGVPRQRTLRALIDWSYDLLTESERAVLRRLSVFRGGWSVEAAEAVCTGEHVGPAAFLDLLTALVTKSMVKVTEREGAARHTLQETVQQYAWEMLAASGETAQARNRQMAWFLNLAERTEPELAVRDQAEWQARLELELDNLRAALEWSLTPLARPDRADEGSVPPADVALRLAGALVSFWDRRGYLREGREWLARALALQNADVPTAARAKALAGAGLLAWQQGDYAATEALSGEALALARQLDDKRVVAVALGNLATAAQQQGDYRLARLRFEESLAAWRALGDKWGIAGVLNGLGNQAWEQGEYAAAAAFYEQGLVLRRELGDLRGLANSLNSLANIAHGRENVTAARSLYAEGLELARQLGDQRGVAHMLNDLGRLEYEQGELEAAHRLLEESLAIKRELGDRRGVANSLHNLGEIARARGDGDQARSLYLESTLVRRELGDLAGIADSLEAFGALESGGGGDAARAVRFFGAASAVRGAIGTTTVPSAETERDGILETLRRTLGNAAYQKAWDAGRAGSWEDAAALALGEAADREPWAWTCARERPE